MAVLEKLRDSLSRKQLISELAQCTLDDDAVGKRQSELKARLVASADPVIGERVRFEMGVDGRSARACSACAIGGRVSTNKIAIGGEQQVVEEYLARCTACMAVIQAERDRLLLQLCNSDGAYDQRHLGVRPKAARRF